MKSTLFDDGWRFYRESENEAPFISVSRKNQEAGGYASRFFNDGLWQEVTLPHDWGMSLDFTERVSRSHGHYPTTPLEADGAAPGLSSYPTIPTKAWYRKTFYVPDELRNKRVYVAFDGVFRDSRLWINGQYVDRFESGYMGFRVDITDNLYFGQENSVALCADSREIEGWWYEGAGIYRHAHLMVCETLHLDARNMAVTADMYGNFSLTGEAVNDGDDNRNASVRMTLDRPSGDEALRLESPIEIPAWEKSGFRFEGKLVKPELWSPDEPKLYTLTVEIFENGRVTDSEQMNIGFRTFRFDADKGLFVNEKPVKIKGACVHQDFAGVGVALPDELHEYKIRKLKEMGCNAYRSAHNAPAPEIVDACDRLGMLIMDETRMFGSTPEALNCMLSLVRRDRNHPSVLMWSMGNEEHSVQNTEVGAGIAKTIKREIKKLDPTRYVTFGGNNGGNYDGINSVADVRGVNYVHMHKDSFIDEYHALHPKQPMYGSEEVSIVAARGEYTGSVEHPSSYGECAMPWSSTHEGWWRFYSERDFLSGGFIWTGFDYFGEPTPYERNVSSSFGVMDLCGFPKDAYYYYRAWWRSEPLLHLFPHWNWNTGDSVRVMVYSNADEVELRLNGRAISKKKMQPLTHLEWNVPFEAGEIEAIGYIDGKPAVSDSRATTGKPAKIRLLREDAVCGGSIKLVKAEILDTDGRLVPTAGNLIHFNVKNAKILGVGNGDPASREKNQYSDRRERREVISWEKLDGDECEPWDAFCLRRGEHYALHTVAQKWTEEKNEAPFRDPVRMVARPILKRRETAFEGTFSLDDNEYDRLEFSLLEGNYRVFLNGEYLGGGNNMGYPCGFKIAPKPGQNRIRVELNDNTGECGIYNGVYISKPVPAKWQRSAYNGLALAIVKAEDGAEISAWADGLEEDLIKL